MGLGAVVYSSSRSQRSEGTSEMTSFPSRSKSQKLAGPVIPPGKRQPIPVIAIGSDRARSAASSFACKDSRAISVCLTSDSGSGALGLLMESNPPSPPVLLPVEQRPHPPRAHAHETQRARSNPAPRQLPPQVHSQNRGAFRAVRPALRELGIRRSRLEEGRVPCLLRRSCGVQPPSTNLVQVPLTGDPDRANETTCDR